MVEYDYKLENGEVNIVFSGYLTINEAKEIKEIFNKAIAESENIKIKHVNCEAIDLTYLQLIIAANRTAKEWGKKFSVLIDENDPIRIYFCTSGFNENEINIIN